MDDAIAMSESGGLRLEASGAGDAGRFRSLRERALQALLYEAIGIALVTPFFSFATATSSTETILVLALVSLTMMVWSPLHNLLFDVCDWKLTGRLASERPASWRAVHAVSHEVTAMAATVPVLMIGADLPVAAALGADIALSLVYAAYAYVFFALYDRLRPL